jgi:hypothetical protein
MAKKQVTFEIEVDDDMDDITLEEGLKFQLGIVSSISMDNPYSDLDTTDFINELAASNLKVS